MAKRSFKSTMVFRPSSFDTAYAEYFSSPDFGKLRKTLNKRQFRTGDKDISYRVLSHWDASGVLPDGVEKEEGWRRFSLIELIWLEVVKRLRNFGVPLERIAEARAQIMDWNEKKQGYPFFELYVAFAWASDKDPYVALLSDGTAYVATMDEINATQLLFYANSDVLLISLKSVLISKGHKVPAAREVFALSENELEVIDALHRNNKRVNVSLKENKVSEIETVEGYSEVPILSELHKGLSEKGVFADLITHHSDGDLQSAEIRRRRRFK
jgi:hypothetical protein